MPVAVKKLHMAKTLQELKGQSTIEKTVDSYNRFEEKDPSQLMKSAMKLYNKAFEIMKSDENELDEEQVYTYLFRAMELWMITNRKISDKKYASLMYGKELNITMTLLEEYESKLEKRYADLKNGVEENNNSLESTFKMSQSIHIKKRKEVKEKHITDFTNNGMKNNSDSDYSSEDFNLISTTAHEQSEFGAETDYYVEKKFIQCEEMKDLLKESLKDHMLILDLRPRKDFQLSQISKVKSVNIPETSVLAGLSASKLGETIDDETQKHYWKHRDQYKQIVLLDWCSEEKDVIPNSPLVNLQTILLKWDPSVIYKNKPLILNGGYERWLDTYPTFTTNAKLERPPKHIMSPFIPISDHNIDYPMNEIEDKGITFFKPGNNEKEPKIPHMNPTHIPSIDRTTKPENTVREDGNVECLDKTVVGAFEMETNDTEEPKELGDNEMENSTIPPSFSSSLEGRLEEKCLEPSESHNPSHTPVRPATPPRSEKPYTGTPKTPKDSGNGDGIILERIKDESITRSGGLKRSASSPNINKLVNEDLDLFDRIPSTPMFDRSTKPNTTNSYDSYSQRGGAGVDTIYAANNKQGRGLTGLKNLGNLCYMNSIMQCLSNTEDLTKELTKFNVDRQVISKRQIASEVSSVLARLWQGDFRITSCRDLKMIVGSLRPSFSTMEQQDSHEFLTILVDWLHEDLNEPSPMVSSEGAIESTGEKAWGEFKKKNHSLVLDLFYGQLKSTVRCKQCNKQSVSFEPFSNLSIPLPSPQETPYDKDSKFSLQDCLKLYLKHETISGWVCPGCKAPREATKKLDITRLPPILIIHLKRFMTEMVGVGWCRKRMNMVDFPINDFDMKPFTHSDSELRFHTYNLYAVSNHYGTMESGHYTAYCKNHVLNKWHKFDDQDVNEMSPADVKSSAAYILFYETSQHQRNHRMTGFD